MAYRQLAPAPANPHSIFGSSSDDDDHGSDEEEVANISNDGNHRNHRPAKTSPYNSTLSDHMKFWGFVRAPPPWSAQAEKKLSQKEIWTSFCETIKASDKLKSEYNLENTASRACVKRLVVHPLATEVEAAMKPVYKTSRAQLEGILQNLITVWCKKYNNLWLRRHAKFVSNSSSDDPTEPGPLFENKLMGHCSKQLVLLADWAIRADALTSLPGEAQDICKNLFVSMCCLHVEGFPGGGEECARYLIALAVGVLLEGEEELKTKTEPSAKSALAPSSGHPASTVHDASRLLETLQTWYEGSFSENVTLAGEPVFLQTKASSRASQPTLGDSSVPRISAEEESIRDSAYRQLVRGHLWWQQQQDRLTAALLEPEVNENDRCTILYTNPWRRELDHTLHFDADHPSEMSIFFPEYTS
ncbi:hypothetical protein QFC24_006152 [Naganishia onofrii]|uniref:Uncharacterized protein n=1 Tax=Naganishia onofrii TaxID=1851511 RepID=A0ACC2X581_9TREE|nr:hypothetical protein QFC24_006152 [Naganishia onofrii]